MNPCYHCGLPIPDGLDLNVIVGEQSRQMCCPGCQAVAQAIVDQGLADYYRSRDALPESPRESLPPALAELLLYDHETFQKSFVRLLDENEREASLLFEGITCAACVWLIEHRLTRVAGVSGAEINYATRRARVRWDSTKVQLSQILAAVAAIGYRAYPYDATRSELLARKERRTALWRLFVAGFGMMQVMMYAIPGYLAGEGDMTADIAQLLRWASFILTVPVIFFSAAPFFRNAWRDLTRARLGIDVPVALGVGGAFIFSCWATFTGKGEVYFDSVTMFVFFLLTGRFMEMTARQKAVSTTEALAKMLPAFADRIAAYPHDLTGESVMAAQLQVGDVVLVRAGELFPADGRVVEGVSNADESLLTGESRPVAKKVGDRVTGGSANVDSPLYIEVDRIGEDTRLSTIVRLMERAAAEKPRMVKMADRVSAYFVLALLIVALIVAGIWLMLAPDKALWITVSVLVVTCPCALSLATPVALTVSSGVMARLGLLVTRGHAIETLARATHFVFDKTGTLTQGRMVLQDVLPLGRLDRRDCLGLAAALERSSEHPLARALCADDESPLPVVEALINETGAGLTGVVSGQQIRIGRIDYVARLVGADLPEFVAAFLDQNDGTVIALGDETGWLALFSIGDEIRPEAPGAIDSLRKHGVEVVLLSGDTKSMAEKVGRAIGIDRVHGDMSPQAKHAFVSELQAQGAVVAMIGDGVNDAPVLAQAQVSVAMGGGSDLARTQADLILLSENLVCLCSGIDLARKTLRKIRQNLLWALIYNAAALPLAALGWVTPWMAGIGMSGSSLFVVMNSLGLQRGKSSGSRAPSGSGKLGYDRTKR